MGDCFLLVAVGCLVHISDANRNGETVLLISKGLGKTLKLQMLLYNSAQGRGLLAAPKRVAPRRRRLSLSACDKDLERVGGEKKRI